jgi:hypothetical protein
MLACHHCDNPPCCNPVHLFQGTHLDNNLDSKIKGRNSFGERRPMAKLTDAVVREIRNIATGTRGESVLISERFHVSRRLVNAVISGERWKHI